MPVKTPSRIPRLYIDTPELSVGDSVSLDGGQSRYLGAVLRLGVGDGVRVFNGHDGEFMARITAAGKKSMQVEIADRLAEQTALPTLMAVFAPVKKTRLDFIVEKATELGAGILQPVMTEYTEPKRVNVTRMRANAIEAAEQTGRLTVPECRNMVRLPELLSDWPMTRHLVFCDETLTGDTSASMASRIKGLKGEVAILTGPEGGFSPAERERLAGMKNSVAVSLGGNILRADTAAVAALSVWQALAGEWTERR